MMPVARIAPDGRSSAANALLLQRFTVTAPDAATGNTSMVDVTHVDGMFNVTESVDFRFASVMEVDVHA